MLGRIVIVAGVAAMIWMAGAAHVVGDARLPLGAIVKGSVMTQAFGCTSYALEPVEPACPGGHFHSGVDLAAALGTPVLAASAGSANVAYDPAGCGLFVSVVNPEHVRVLYCHLSAARIESGLEVMAGDLIGEVGASGLATGPHVHFEVEIDGRPIDPALWLRP